jgi:ferredoxin-NADP reductase/DMSO/TMAO reductase YedYZ heme-binding membrane subunit
VDQHGRHAFVGPSPVPPGPWHPSPSSGGVASAPALAPTPASETAPRSGRHRGSARGLPAHGRTTLRGNVALTLAGVGLGITLGIAVGGVREVIAFPGGPASALGMVTALVGTYLCLMMLLLVSRVPWIEREVGHDRLVLLHRRTAPYALVLIGIHVLATSMGLAQAGESSLLGAFWSTVTTTQWMVPATVAFVLMVALGVASYRRVRSRMAYETWWVAHLYFYLAVALAFGHQIAVGSMFVEHPEQRWFWIGLYVAVGGLLLGSRVVLPALRSARHDLRVAAVVPETTDTVSVYLTGRDLDLLGARGGQFFQWRFVTRDWWWQAHPFSLSAPPNGQQLRITVRRSGDLTGRLASLRPGTRVWFEGPYGTFHAAARHSDRVTALAAGVGITPIRAMLEDLPDGTEVTVVHRVSTPDEAVLREELTALSAERGWHLQYVVGPRTLHPMNTHVLRGLAPWIASSDVYVCGPEDFTRAAIDSALTLGTPRDRIHHESFAF